MGVTMRYRRRCGTMFTLMISHDLQCIFIHIPKTAGTSIEQKLGHFKTFRRGVQDHRTVRDLQPLGVRDLLHPSRARLLRTLVRHRLRREPALSRRQFDTYFKFTFVRNPWARVFSWYQNVLRDPHHQANLRIQPECSFADFLQNHAQQPALRPQLDWLRDHFGRIPLDFIGRFENLADDFTRVCDRLGIEDATLPHLITGSGEDYSAHYDDLTRRLVAQRYAEEISMFGYRFEP